MSCRARRRHPLGPAAIVAVLLTLLTTSGCGRKGPPLPPLREPDPVAETVPSEEGAIGAESSTSEAEGDEDDGETSSENDPNDGGNDDGPP